MAFAQLPIRSGARAGSRGGRRGRTDRAGSVVPRTRRRRPPLRSAGSQRKEAFDGLSFRARPSLNALNKAAFFFPLSRRLLLIGRRNVFFPVF